MRYAMIMAGGSGTRLWPLSRAGTPKQLIDFIRRPGDTRSRSLLELAATRLDGLVEPEHRYICTGEQYRDIIKRKLPDFTDEQIMGEPEGRDTVNAVGFAAAVLAKNDPDAVFAVLTADHIIEPDDVFRASIDKGFRLVEDDPSRLVTFSIKPTHPATGFGYVERAEPIRVEGAGDGCYTVARFVEKPDFDRATEYLKSGRFGWNSGMFVFSARTFLDCLEKFVPESAKGLQKIADAWGTPDQKKVLREEYPKLPKISVDYAVMEPASNDDSVTICGVEMPLRWLDVGSWPSYGETLETDPLGNRTSGSGETVLVDSRHNLVVTDGDKPHTVALLGCEGLIVVHTPEATLVMPSTHAQELKKLHAELRDGMK